MPEKEIKKKQESKIVHKLGEQIKKEIADKYDKSRLRILELPMDDVGNEFLEVAALVPPRDIAGQLMKFVDTNPKKMQEIAIANCLLSNKTEVQKNDHLYYSAAFAIVELIPIKQARIKNF